MDSYGEAIEYDLHHEYGLDLLDFFRRRHSWRKLYNLLVRLPRASAFVQERLEDPATAEWALSQPDPGPYRPAVQEFTPEIAALYDICDRLGEVIAAVLVAGGRKPPAIKPHLRPISGVERARARKDLQRHLSLVGEVHEAQARWKAMREKG